MAYVSAELVAKKAIRKSLWQRVHWERVGLLAVNFAIWAVIIGLFT
jgi:hypothetical protein